MLVVVLGLVSIWRNEDYRSEVGIWRDTVAKRPKNARAHNNLGFALFNQGELEQAIRYFTEALQLNPHQEDEAKAHNNLGVALADQGHLTAKGPGPTDVLTAPVEAGTYLVSYHVDDTDNALFINGVMADTGSGGGGTPELLDSCGPGFVLGQRISYWWEMAQEDVIAN